MTMDAQNGFLVLADSRFYTPEEKIDFNRLLQIALSGLNDCIIIQSGHFSVYKVCSLR